MSVFLPRSAAMLISKSLDDMVCNRKFLSIIFPADTSLLVFWFSNAGEICFSGLIWHLPSLKALVIFESGWLQVEQCNRVGEASLTRLATKKQAVKESCLLLWSSRGCIFPTFSLWISLFLSKSSSPSFEIIWLFPAKRSDEELISLSWTSLPEAWPSIIRQELSGHAWKC